MPEQRMVGARVTTDWQQQIQELIVALAGLMSTLVMREAIAQSLGRTDPSSIPGDLAAMSNRVTVLELQAIRVGEIDGLK